MSFHRKPEYQIPELIQALKDHGLEHDKPSQLADSFRTGWMAGRAAAQAAQPEAVSIKVLEIALDRLQYISDFFCDEAGGDDWHLKGVAIDALEEIQRVRASAPTPEPMSAPTEAKPAQDAVDAAYPDMDGQAVPEIGSTWGHSNGDTYTVTGYADMFSDNHQRRPPRVIYRSAKTGRVWSRELSDWYRAMQPERAAISAKKGGA